MTDERKDLLTDDDAAIDAFKRVADVHSIADFCDKLSRKPNDWGYVRRTVLAFRDAILTAARQSDEAGKREAAREALTRWAQHARAVGQDEQVARNAEIYRDREYPLPSRECVLSEPAVGRSVGCRRSGKDRRVAR